MKIYTTLIALIVLSVSCVCAQSISPQVIASNGVFATGGGYSLSYTTGQAASATLTASPSVITQGFQQPNDAYTGLQTFDIPSLNVQLYPNPAVNEVNLVINSAAASNYSAQLLDILGRVLQQPTTTQLTNGQARFVFNIQQLPCAMYFITVSTNSSAITHTFKFNKIN